MTRSLVIAPQWIGDAVMTEPLMATLARRAEVLTVAAVPWVAPVYRAMPQVAGVIELPFAHKRLDWAARRAIGRSLQGQFDRAYVLPNSIKSALLPWMARIPERIGYRGEGRWLLLNRAMPNARGRPAMVEFYGALASVAVGKPAIVDAGAGRAHARTDELARPRLRLPADTLQSALAAAGLVDGEYWAFAPGAEFGPAKRWPAEHYALLARSLHATSSLPVVLLGSAKEAALCEHIASLSHGACTILAGKTSLIDAMAIVASARGVVSNDSGLMHVAAAFGVAQAAAFGSSSPLHTPPLNAHARVMWRKDELRLDCMPCFARVCRYGHTRCLGELMPERVEAALAEAVASRADAGGFVQ